MTEFRPCIAVTKAKINGTAIRDGQLIVVVETGELFFDYNGRRIALVQGGGSPDDEEESDPLFCSIVNADIRISSSVQGGGGMLCGLTADLCPGTITPEFNGGSMVFSIFHGNP